MYVLILLVYFFPPGAGSTWGTARWVTSDKASCEIKRDALLAAHSPVGKPSGPTPNPYLTDAWCFNKDQFDKENHG
jgi:hypothetical protein